MVISHADPEETPPLEEDLHPVQGDYFDRISSKLPPLSAMVEERLSILTRIADVLGLDDLSFSSYCAALIHLSDEDYSLKLSSLRLLRAENELRAHLASARHEEKLINKWKTAIEKDQEKGATADMERKKEVLVKKAKEYKKELDVLMVHVKEPAVTVTQLAAQHERVKKREADIKAKHAKIRAFQGLPPNLELARIELKRAQEELMELIKLRERILGRMADGVT